ncbi:TonB-dependent receptor [Sediminibacterium goheungense]|uniref:TonB-dependent receptor n=2 Tax=Sediminibacterium goheungense TaxID=1086393 RepID=A0A4R6IZ76_9BACT|nr:TonB-dependent receptor [Sediminibacterium goheungense]
MAMVCLFMTTILYAQNGTIKVKIIDEQKLNLPGANVSLDNQKMSAISNTSGVATFYNVPAGTHTLRISYLGYKDYEKSITSTGTVSEFTASLESGVSVLKGVIVLGDRLKGQSKALNQQKNTDNISNIISADQIGRFPDANIGDAIKRVPGIAMQNDQGEARNIIVRGMGPEFNSVTLNGERIPSAEGDNRRIQMDLIPADMIQTVEVSKTLTADMDADAIGGSVNLVTRTAPNGKRLSATVAGGYNPIRASFIGTVNFIAGSRFAKNKLGYVISGSFNRNEYGSDNVEAVWSKDANGKLYVSDHDQRIYDLLRIRRSATATVDYKISPLHTIYVTGSYNWRDDKENRFRLRHRFRGNAATDLIYDAAGNISGYNVGEVLRQTKGGAAGGRVDNRRLEDQRVRSLAIKGEHLFGKVKTDWSVQFARASEERPNERYISMGRRNITVTQDISNPERPYLTDNTALTGYTRRNELTEQFQNQFEKDINAKLNFEIPASIVKTQSGNLKFGLRLRSKEKKRDNNFFEYTPIGASAGSFANISLLPLTDKTASEFYPGERFAAGLFVSPGFLGGLNFKDATRFTESDVPEEYLSGNFSAKETISAGYIELKQNFSDRWSANMGVRIEKTSINYSGNIVEDGDQLKGIANLKNSYTDFLPNVNAKYKFDNNTVFKGAITRSIARPRYYDLVPFFNINPNDQELSAGNPKMEPVRSWNIDLMFEKYYKSVGIISGGVFYKKIDRFFYTYLDQQYTQAEFSRDFPTITNPIGAGENWQFTQRRNGDGASLLGLEVAAQRQLDFLPGIWKGFGVYFNYTYTYSKADGIYDGGGSLVRSNVKLPGAAPHIFNFSLSYENSKFVSRLSANYTSSYVDDSDDAGYNADSFNDRFYDKQFFLDFNASYAVNHRTRIFTEANNLTNQPLRYYQGNKSRTAQLEYYGPRFNFGLKFDINK